MMDDLISRQAAIDAVEKNACNTQRIFDAIKYLPSAQPEHWIPCSERLPEEYGEYICTMENGQVQECGFVPDNRAGMIEGWSTCEADGYKLVLNTAVIAWMPLPEPYREEGD